jgi:PKHD-type hydroxylase
MTPGLTYNLENTSYVLNTCVTLDDIFTNDELSIIEHNLNLMELRDAPLGNGNIKDNVRKSEIDFLSINDQNKWVFDKFYQAVNKINTNTYRFDLTGFEYMQYTVYKDNLSHYDWHIDTLVDGILEDNKLTRKLSISFILSDQDEYEGGDFEILSKNFNEPIEIVQKRNRLIAFPSFFWHKVSPVTKGTRRSLVFWVLGPKFK